MLIIGTTAGLLTLNLLSVPMRHRLPALHLVTQALSLSAENTTQREKTIDEIHPYQFWQCAIANKNGTKRTPSEEVTSRSTVFLNKYVDKLITNNDSNGNTLPVWSTVAQ
jgi:hypothetical protein